MEKQEHGTPREQEQVKVSGVEEGKAEGKGNGMGEKPEGKEAKQEGKDDEKEGKASEGGKEKATTGDRPEAEKEKPKTKETKPGMEKAATPPGKSRHENRVVHLENAQIARGRNVVLKNVVLEVYEGDFYYLVGRVGTGKSSLIDTMTGETPLAGGRAKVCGFELEHLKERQIPYLRRAMGVVFQDFKLLTDRNVERNLRFALRATGWKNRVQIAQRIEEVLSLVGLTHKAGKMPHQLSGGEQQRIAIARALLNEPSLILADEPTGNLDPETSEGILGLLVDLSKRGKAVIMATHNYGLVKKFPAQTLQCTGGALRLLSPEALIDLSPWD